MMSILPHVGPLVRSGVHLTLAGAMTASIFAALPWSLHGAKSHVEPVYELMASEPAQVAQLVVPTAVHDEPTVEEGEQLAAEDAGEQPAVVEETALGDGTTSVQTGAVTPVPIVAAKVERSGLVREKRRLGITTLQTGRVFPRLADRATPTKKKRRTRKCLDPVDEIQELGVGQWQVSKEFVFLYTKDKERFNSLGRVVRSHDERGKPEGWQLRRIRCGSPLHQGGLRNGDVVLEVDGRRVGSIFQVFRAYRKSKRREVIHVKVRRKGQLVNLTYHIA